MYRFYVNVVYSVLTQPNVIIHVEDAGLLRSVRIMIIVKHLVKAGLYCSFLEDNHSQEN